MATLSGSAMLIIIITMMYTIIISFSRQCLLAVLAFPVVQSLQPDNGK